MRVEEDARKRFGKALKKRKSFSGITLWILNVAVSELMFAFWFFAMAPILKRVAVVFVGNYERVEGWGGASQIGY